MCSLSLSIPQESLFLGLLKRFVSVQTIPALRMVQKYDSVAVSAMQRIGNDEDGHTDAVVEGTGAA